MKLILYYMCLCLMLLPEESAAQEVNSFRYINGVASYGINRFINKKPFSYDDSTVTFFIRNWQEAKRVFLTGNFCNWSDNAFPMTKTPGGWKTTVKLPVGKYWYKFIIDGKWKTDSDNLIAERDVGGDINSVYYKANALFTLTGHSNATKVFIAGAFNNWKTDELQMEKHNSVWNLPLYLSRGTHAYNFIVDGKVISQKPEKKRTNVQGGLHKLTMEIADHNRDLYGSNQFLNGTGFAVDDSTVTFVLKGYLDAKKVYVCGSWMSWVKDSLPMIRTSVGWERKVKLSPGKHFYKFVIDDTWIIDPNNVLHENNNAAALDNSVYYKTNTCFNLADNHTAHNVFLTGSFNSWNPSDLKMNKSKSGWQISVFLSGGTHTYAFVVDGNRYPDPDNRNQKFDRTGQLASVVHVNTAFESIGYYYEQLDAAELLGDSRKIATGLLNIGNAYRAKGEHAEALFYFEKALSYFRIMGDFVATGDLLLKGADEVRFFNDPTHELDLLKGAVTSYTAAKNNRKLRTAFAKLGDYYLRSREYYRAIVLFKDALAADGTASDTEMAALLGNIAHAYSYTSEQVWQLHFASKALLLNEAAGNKNAMAENLLILGDYHRTKGNYDVADSLYRRSLRIYDSTANQFGIAWVKYSLAQLLLKADSTLPNQSSTSNKKLLDAVNDLKTAAQTFKDHRSFNLEIACLLAISNASERGGDFAEAHRYYKKYVEARDYRTNSDKKNAIMLADLNYASERKQDSLRFENELSDRKLREQILLAGQQRQRLELNASQLALVNTEKEVQHLSFLKTQADLENERLLKQKVQREQKLQNAQLTEMKQRSAIASLNEQRLWIYIIGGFILLALSSIYFIYRSRSKNSRLKAELEKEVIGQRLKEADFQKKLADISMSALRSQMNPHFIFNCLNSIKYYTLQNDTVAASDYLTKFSKLIRLVLENSRNDRITLSSELAALELYIQMEAMRFKDKLNYSISVEDDVEADYFEIPPLLLQPFVENAIWHGLMHKEEGGKIDVAVSTVGGGSALQIVISDNGIGRKKASEINKRGSQKHKSYAMQATSERIALINQIYKSNAVIHVADLVDDNQEGTGTQITIQIAV